MLRTANRVFAVPTITGRGTVTTVPTFTNPLITSSPSSPDPWITYQAGFYYFCASVENEIWVWKSPSISGLDSGFKMSVWSAPKRRANSKEVWAPELHFLGGKWYIYYAASDGKNANHRMYVLESVTSDPQGDYFERGKLSSPDDKWAIDGTILQHYDSSLYFIWSGWPGAADGLQNLYIAPMCNPWTISGERVLLATPTYAWEGWINEGPQILQHNDKLFLIFSANASWTADYCLGVLTFNGGDILNPATWVKHTAPVFKKAITPDGGVYGVGHCSFTKSPDGREDWLLYHGKDNPKNGWKRRSTRAQKFSWDIFDGSPIFGQPVPANIPLLLPSGENEICGGAS